MSQLLSPMRVLCAAVLLLLAVACERAAEEKPAYGLIEGTGVTATVIEKDGQWSVHYIFAEPQTAMLFSRSSGGYRTGQWTARMPGAAVETLGGFDALIFDEPQRSATFDFIPYTEDVPKDYTPFIRFSDGALAMFTGQFEVLPAQSAQEIADLNGDLGAWQGEQPVLGVRMITDQPMIVGGARKAGEVQSVTKGGGDYIYVGDGVIEEGASFIGVIDRELPSWLRGRFDGDLTNIFRVLEEGWGFALPEKATVLFAFKGYDGNGYSNQGGVLGNLLALESSGSALREENEAVLAHLHWFFAHEAVHLFQAAKGIELASSEDAWIHEGAANMMAHLVADELTGRPTPLVETYAPVLDKCAGYLGNGPLREAGLRGQFDAHYECGDLIALMTDAVLPTHSLYDFWNALLEEAEVQNKPRVDAPLYFETMAKLGAGEVLIGQLQSLVQDELEDPAAHLTAAMTQAGLAPAFGEDGTLTAITLPQ